ncbi:MAG: ImmA/IrrE family metallo-endopeptidase [Acinetobacter venetianus]|uniref:ImmA/IrrE family metallo-endopeptidase n=1 Tax=Acinetobacter venetianus TaxID=52133 RepID=UPI003C70A898
MEAIFWARKLTIEKINLELNKNRPKQAWVSGQELEIDNSWGVRYPVRIHMFDLTQYSNKTIDHMVMSYVKIGQNNEINIFLNDVNNHCWKRFFIFKELIHVVSSNKENATVGSKHLLEVLTNLHDQNFKTSDSAFWAEEDAKFGAIEILLPKELVEQIENQYESFEDITDKDIYEIAHKYKIPKVIVKLRLKDAEVRDYFARAYKSSLYHNAQFMPVYKKHAG